MGKIESIYDQEDRHMSEKVIRETDIQHFSEYLLREEKSSATYEKYCRDVREFYFFTRGEPVTKELVIAYKKDCMEKNYAVRSINSMLASINSFLDFMGWRECKVKSIRLQKQTFCAEEKELTREEYLRLLKAAKEDEQLYMILQTICGTGIRVSELKYFTLEMVKQGSILVSCKNKTRTILLPGKLKKILVDFAKKRKIKDGVIFVNKSGMPVNRTCIWRRMKKLCKRAQVKASKVFPHNLRKLFARTFYSIEKDIAKLADILGHSSINTTRIYIMTTCMEHRRQMDRLGLVV